RRVRIRQMVSTFSWPSAGVILSIPCGLASPMRCLVCCRPWPSSNAPSANACLTRSNDGILARPCSYSILRAPPYRGAQFLASSSHLYGTFSTEHEYEDNECVRFTARSSATLVAFASVTDF
ncbi:hypothetical protein EV401DRAFT_2017025, partial [Pisolithus croceorrhizus]